MKKLIALLLTLALLCASLTALAEKDPVAFENLGWQITDDDHMALDDELMDKVKTALKGYKDGKVQPVLVLATQPATASASDTDMSAENKDKLMGSLDDYLKTLGGKTNVVSTTYVHGDDVCVLCRVTPKDSKKPGYWMLAFVSYEGELLHTVKLDTEYVKE